MIGYLRRTTGRRAFTLLEVILAIAMLGLVASLFITGGNEMFRARQRTMVDVFWDAVQAARLQAVQGDTTVTMRFEEKSRRLLWGPPSGEPHGVDWPGRNLEFLPLVSRDSIMLGGQLVGVGRIEAVRFHADGTTDRYRVQLTDSAGQVSRLEIDPWTTAPILRSTP
jgi:prepilin-type N-terminal cleavage/methylation domain-containing protein